MTEFTDEAFGRIECALEIAAEDISAYTAERLGDVAVALRGRAVGPFCQKHGLKFRSNNGDWYFIIDYDGADKGKLWEVGEAPRPLPGRPPGPEGDEDRWWAPITPEDRRILRALNMSVCGQDCIGSFVPAWPARPRA